MHLYLLLLNNTHKIYTYMFQETLSLMKISLLIYDTDVLHAIWAQKK